MRVSPDEDEDEEEEEVPEEVVAHKKHMTGAGTAATMPVRDERQQDDRAKEVIDRITAKLHGTDFHAKKGAQQKDAAPAPPLDVVSQVERLVMKARAHDNLCQLYIGWNPFW